MVAASRSEPRRERRDVTRNREALARAATAAVHREGPQVPMATIAADAGVGVGTLYRHFPSRDDLLNFLTLRSFEQVRANVRAAEAEAPTAADALRRFVEAAIAQRRDLVLPLHGGPPAATPEVVAIRREVHTALQRLIDRGRHDGTIRAPVAPREVVVFGAMLAQPRPVDPSWDATCQRLLAIWINGLAVAR